MYEWYELSILCCFHQTIHFQPSSKAEVSKVSPTFVGCYEAAEAAAEDPPVSAEADFVATSTAESFDFTQLIESIATVTWGIPKFGA